MAAVFGIALNVVVALATGVGMVPVAKSFIPKNPPALTTTVRLIIGNVADDAASLSGNVPGIALWDDYGNFLGSKPGNKNIIDKGNFFDIDIVSDKKIGNVAAAYIAVSNGGDDALCIAGITLTNPDTSQSSWSGDIAALCPQTGAAVYQQDKQIADNPDGEHVAPHPHCMWIDRDRSNGIPHQGFSLHLPDFGIMSTSNQTTAYNISNDLMCSRPRFDPRETFQTESTIGVYVPTLEYNSDGTDKDPSRILNPTDVMDAFPSPGVKPTFVPRVRRGRRHPRHYPLVNGSSLPTQSIQKVPGARAILSSSSKNNNMNSSADNTGSASAQHKKHRFDGHCIITNNAHNSALRLCEHPNTWGPSMASTVDGLFCDMIEKKLYKICDAEVKVDDPMINLKVDPVVCFDITTVKLRMDSKKAPSSKISMEGTSSAEASPDPGKPTNKVSTATDSQQIPPVDGTTSIQVSVIGTILKGSQGPSVATAADTQSVPSTATINKPEIGQSTTKPSISARSEIPSPTIGVINTVYTHVRYWGKDQ